MGSEETANSPSKPVSPGHERQPSTPRVLSPRFRQQQLLQEAQLLAKTDVKVKYHGASLSPRTEYDNRGVSTWHGPHGLKSTPKPLRKQYYRTVQQSYEYVNVSYLPDVIIAFAQSSNVSMLSTEAISSGADSS